MRPAPWQKRRLEGEGNRRSLRGAEAVHPRLAWSGSREMGKRPIRVGCMKARLGRVAYTTHNQERSSDFPDETKMVTWKRRGPQIASAHLFRRRYRLLVWLLRASDDSHAHSCPVGGQWTVWRGMGGEGRGRRGRYDRGTSRAIQPRHVHDSWTGGCIEHC